MSVHIFPDGVRVVADVGHVLSFLRVQPTQVVEFYFGGKEGRRERKLNLSDVRCLTNEKIKLILESVQPAKVNFPLPLSALNRPCVWPI